MRAVVTDEKTIIDGKVKILTVFDGKLAIKQAVAFISKLPEHETGRYGIDACIPSEDAHCDGCECRRERDEKEPTVDDLIEAVIKCLDWCSPMTPDQTRVMCATVRHNWRRFLPKR